MTNTREIGSNGENQAVEFLEKAGYEVLHRNWYSSHHELDIVARKNGIVAIIEVKSLKYNGFREPYQQVTFQKQRAMISAANAYIRSQNITDEVRFDIISIVNGRGEPQIEHIENAFYPRLR